MEKNLCDEYLSPYFELSIYPELSVVIFKIKVMVLGNGMASQLHVLKKIR